MTNHETFPGAQVIRIDSIDHHEIDVYVRLTGAQLRNKLEKEKGIFIAESPTVIEVALDAGCEPLSMLIDERLVNGDVRNTISRCAKLANTQASAFPVYTSSRDVLTEMTGFELTRGALCAMRRPPEKSADELLDGAKKVAVLEDIADATNVGAIFRSAAALGIDAILLSPSCCDPLCRRSLRVSMGTALLIPHARLEKGDTSPFDIGLLHRKGFTTLAMALSDDSVSLGSDILQSKEKTAIILGTEGTGLSKDTISLSDYTVKIPMARGVDSLNVGAAAAIAFWQLSEQK